MRKRHNKQDVRESEIESVTLSLLSPEGVRGLSSGEVTKHHTIDAGTWRPVPGGLHCQKIFGPLQRGTCGCGVFHKNWKKQKYCTVCKVEFVDPRERRRRFGHIELTVPVVHPWYRRHIALLLALSPKNLVRLIVCDAYMVEKEGLSGWKKGDIITTPEYFAYMAKCAENNRPTRCDYFMALTGGKLIGKMLSELDIQGLVRQLRGRKQSRRVNVRLLLARTILQARTSPERMVLENILVLPPDLRPSLVFDDGTIAESDLNTLYGKVIIRNNRLRTLYESNAPEVVINIGRKQLQRAVDALFDNERRVGAKDRGGKRVLKSLSSVIEKKTGRMRRNLLGKRVDFSGRSVIVVGPGLKLHQCALPFELAMDMCRPFVYGRLMRWGYAASLQHARALVEAGTAGSMDALEEELKERTVLLNRAPSLHRMSFQAFEPVLVKEKAIRLHPLVCSAFNADFDGDQMGVHLPVGIDAQIESRILMLSCRNLFSPATGKLVPAPSQDIVLGIYYLTKDYSGLKGEGRIFAGMEDLSQAYDHGVVDLQAVVKVRIDGEIVETTPGRVIFAELFGGALPFATINRTVRKKDIVKLVEAFYAVRGARETAELLDRLKDAGFQYATLSGVSICSADMMIPVEKPDILAAAEKKVRETEGMFLDGVMAKEEKSNKIIDIWREATEELGEKMAAALDESNSLFLMMDSGARGSKEQIRQMGAMRGLMAKPNGEIVEIPIKSNLREGLTYHEYLLACHGARKGRADGALKTKNAGYFTRRLVDVAHDIVINGEDCGVVTGLLTGALRSEDRTVTPIEDRIKGRVLAKAVYDGDRLIAAAGTLVTGDIAQMIVNAGMAEVEIRSPLTCCLETGVCAKCYGLDLSSKALPVVGDAVGIIAAQSIGEPGTQLTLRTFHSGGGASGGNKRSSIEAKTDGVVVYHDLKTAKGRDRGNVVVSRGGSVSVKGPGGVAELEKLPCGAMLRFEDGASVIEGEQIAQWDPYNTVIVSASGGKAALLDVIEGVTMRSEIHEETGLAQSVITAMHKDMSPRVQIGGRDYVLPIGAVVAVHEGDEVETGDTVARVPKKTAKNADITGGLNFVVNILEARKPQQKAVLAEIDGEVEVKPPKGNIAMLDVVGHDQEKRHQQGNSDALCVFTGDSVRAGDILFEGQTDIRDILRIHGRLNAARYVIDEVQKEYRNNGVEIDDKHFEIILSKMLGKVRIKDPGTSEYVGGELVPLREFETNKAKAKDAEAEQIILSLTNASLHSESWLSAASFQNTTSVLAGAAVGKRKDDLRGTKENILVGNLVPVGTGHRRYRDTFVMTAPAAEDEKKDRAAKEFFKLFGA